MLILVIRIISVAKNHWLVHICIGLEVLLMDPISRCKAGTRTIYGLNGNNFFERIILEDYMVIKIWEVCMPKPLLLLPIK
jgi:hypothetical protein